MDFPTGSGSTDGPISPDAWKRAVYRAAPAHFCVEMLSPTKQGGSFSYGMRICPLREDGGSVSSKGSNSEYEVWRRWEDCLWFQETIEMEYARMSRQKRQRLMAGKGVKKNGVYIHSDEAASFESLPPGPDPHSIAQDIHDFIPKLTKKGTLFRASQATIDQRQKEIQALVDGLFQEDVPTLVKELRASRTVTDFFAFWRRDYDLAIKHHERRNSKPRNSISSSVFSMYFSTSNPSLQPPSALPPVPQSPVLPASSSSRTLPAQIPRRRGSSSTAASSVSGLNRVGPQPGSAPADLFVRANLSHKKHNHSSSYADDDARITQAARSSTSSQSSGSPRDSKVSLPPNTPHVLVEELPIVFGHNPQQVSEYPPVDHPSSILESLPEDSELAAPTLGKPVQLDDMPPPVRRNRKMSSNEVQANRSGQIFIASSHDFMPEERDEVTSVDSYQRPSRNSLARSSWQSAASIPASYLADLGVSLPVSPIEMTHRRASIASMASFMTDSSADAIIPRLEASSQFSSSFLNSNLRRSLSTGSRRPRPMSVPEENWFEQDEEFLDAYFDQSQRSLSPDIAEAEPLGHLLSTPPSSSEQLPSIFSKRASISTDTSAHTTPPISPTSPGTLTVKAAFNSSIFLIRAPKTITLKEMRQKLYDKFVGQEGVQLSASFGILYIAPANPDTAHAKGRARSTSFSSLGASDPSQMLTISSQQEWDQVVSSAGSNKLTLRILNSVSQH